ncbi:MAG: hypothetical protein ABI835_11005 [Chloroflexota bacterium]
MKLIRRLLGREGVSDAYAAFPIRFPGGRIRNAVRASQNADPNAVITALGLPHPMPTIMISGGADGMTAGEAALLRPLIENGLVRFASSHSTSLIDGGTTAGVMPLIGAAREQQHASFPLIGVAPEQQVRYPGHNLPEIAGGLDAGHSHFVLIDGKHFGAESEMILQLAYALSGAGAKKRLAVVLNGGEIVREEAHRCATREPRFPLLVLEGSGRFADELAAARQTASGDPLIREILEQGSVDFIPVSAGADHLYRWLENFFRE